MMRERRRVGEEGGGDEKEQGERLAAGDIEGDEGGEEEKKRPTLGS